MALSTCPKCNSTMFEMREIEPSKTLYMLLTVQCAGCGAVVGVMEAENVGAKLDTQNEALKRIAKAVGANVSDILP